MDDTVIFHLSREKGEGFFHFLVRRTTCSAGARAVSIRATEGIRQIRDWQVQKKAGGETYGFAAARLTLGAGTSQRTSGPKLGAVSSERHDEEEDRLLELMGKVFGAGLGVEATDEQNARHGAWRSTRVPHRALLFGAAWQDPLAHEEGHRTAPGTRHTRVLCLAASPRGHPLPGDPQVHCSRAPRNKRPRMVSARRSAPPQTPSASVRGSVRKRGVCGRA